MHDIKEIARYFKLALPEAGDEKINRLCLLSDVWYKKWYGSHLISTNHADTNKQNDEHFVFTKIELQTLDSIIKEYGKKTSKELDSTLSSIKQ